VGPNILSINCALRWWIQIRCISTIGYSLLYLHNVPVMTTPFAIPARASSSDIAAALAAARTQTGKTLAELSVQSPLLLIFLRHFG
jgi:hypothetical protein